MMTMTENIQLIGPWTTSGTLLTLLELTWFLTQWVFHILGFQMSSTPLIISASKPHLLSYELFQILID